MGGVSKIAEGRKYLSLHSSMAFGENKCNSVCDSSSFSLLLQFTLTDGTTQHAREKHPELQFTDDFSNNLSRGAGHSNV